MPCGMTCLVLVMPALTAAWPVLVPILTAAASACGFARLSRDQAVARLGKRAARAQGIELTLAEGQEELLADVMQRDTTFTAAKGDVTISISRGIRGGIRVWASGEHVPKEGIRQEAQAFVNRIAQQWAYHNVMTELGARGFQVVSESVDAQRRIRLLVRRYC